MLRVGILMPRSTLYPSLGLDLLNGLKQSLKHTGLFDTIKLLIDNIGFGTDEPEIYTKAEKMLLQEDADIVIVCADSRIAEMLQPVFTASNKILLIVNFGASYPDSWQPAPTTITHTLNFAFNAWLTGKLAAAETNKQAVNAISYYDGGYRQCYAMLNAHQQNGGVPCFNHITHLKLSEFTLEPLVEFLEQHSHVQTLLCLFSGDQAERFYTDIAPIQQKFQLHLYVSPMMLETALQKNLPNDFTIDQVQGFIPWHPMLPNEHNNAFKIAHEQSPQQINYFSLLGWDTGLIIQELYRQYELNGTNAMEAVKAVTGKELASPRGWLKIDPSTHQTYGPSYLASMQNAEIMLQPGFEEVEAEWTNFTSETLPPGESSSWRNTYLCI